MKVPDISQPTDSRTADPYVKENEVEEAVEEQRALPPGQSDHVKGAVLRAAFAASSLHLDIWLRIAEVACNRPSEQATAWRCRNRHCGSVSSSEAFMLSSRLHALLSRRMVQNVLHGCFRGER